MFTSKSPRRRLPILLATAAIGLGATGVAGAAIPAAPVSNPPKVSIPAPWETQAVLPSGRIGVDVSTYLATQ